VARKARHASRAVTVSTYTSYSLMGNYVNAAALCQWRPGAKTSRSTARLAQDAGGAETVVRARARAPWRPFILNYLLDCPDSTISACSLTTAMYAIPARSVECYVERSSGTFIAPIIARLQLFRDLDARVASARYHHLPALPV